MTVNCISAHIKAKTRYLVLRIDSLSATSLHYIKKNYAAIGECPGKVVSTNAGCRSHGSPSVIGTCLFMILTAGAQVKRRLEFGSEISVGEASQAMLAVHAGLE
jgi:hypothetical protein